MVVVDPRKIKIAQPTLPTESITDSAALTNGDAIRGSIPTSPPRRRNSKQAIALSNPEESSPASESARVIRTPKPMAVSPAPEPEATPTTTAKHGPPPSDPVLFTIRQLGRTLDDIERLRIMNGNRVGAGKREGVELPWMDAISAQMDALEHSIELELKRAWRKHPLAGWAKAIPGAGELLMARLIAEIDGDRVDLRTEESHPGPLRAPNPAKLLAYCGHGDPARSGQVPKGATQEELFKRGSPAAKKATWKLAYQFMRTVGSEPTHGRNVTHSIDASAPESDAATILTSSNATTPRRPRSPYRDIYDERKTATAGKLHEKPCVRCGPSGKPAAAGSPWSDAHRHADALRIVGKRFLIDLWVAARDLQDPRDTQSRNEIAGE